MIKSKKLFVINVLLITIMMLSLLTAVFATSQAHADTAYSTDEEEQPQPRGLLCKLKLTISGQNGGITAKVKNEFTLGNSTIVVIVELYSSAELQYDVTKMTLENTNQIGDLNINKALYVSASTGGRQRYWCARMRYKFDSDDWVTKETGVILFDKDGNKIS